MSQQRSSSSRNAQSPDGFNHGTFSSTLPLVATQPASFGDYTRQNPAIGATLTQISSSSLAGTGRLDPGLQVNEHINQILASLFFSYRVSSSLQSVLLSLLQFSPSRFLVLANLVLAVCFRVSSTLRYVFASLRYVEFSCCVFLHNLCRACSVCVSS